jgi:hypothetical protein
LSSVHPALDIQNLFDALPEVFSLNPVAGPSALVGAYRKFDFGSLKIPGRSGGRLGFFLIKELLNRIDPRTLEPLCCSISAK